MTVNPAAQPVNFNLAVESLRRTLRNEITAATALYKSQQLSKSTLASQEFVRPESRRGFGDDDGSITRDPYRGDHVNTDV